MKYLRLVTLLYADDTVIIGESEEDLQSLLDQYDEYCQKNKLKVNIEKTKIVRFTRKREKTKKELNFIWKKEHAIEVVEQFNFLGNLLDKKYF